MHLFGGVVVVIMTKGPCPGGVERCALHPRLPRLRLRGHFKSYYKCWVHVVHNSLLGFESEFPDFGALQVSETLVPKHAGSEHSGSWTNAETHDDLPYIVLAYHMFTFLHSERLLPELYTFALHICTVVCTESSIPLVYPEHLGRQHVS